jgi:hypothetical protein
MVAPGFIETDLAGELRASPLGRGRNIPKGIPPSQSAAGIAKVIDQLTAENSKVVYNYDFLCERSSSSLMSRQTSARKPKAWLSRAINRGECHQ